MDLPPLPPGATLDNQGSLPPLPPGATLDQPKTAFPQLPDTTAMRDAASANLVPPVSEDGTRGPVPTAMPERLDQAMGFSATSAMRSDNGSQDIQLPQNVRQELVNSYKSGTSTGPVDFFQSIIPSVAKTAMAFRSGFEEATGGEQNLGITPGGDTEKFLQRLGLIPDWANGQVTIPGIVTGSAIQTGAKLGEALLQAPVGAAYGALNALRAIEPHPENAGSISHGLGELTDYLFNSPLLAELGHIQEGHEVIKPLVGDILKKDAATVTPDDINNTISKGFANAAPKAQDFHDVAAAMRTDPEILHNIYAETGVRPEQVFSDAKTNPAVAADITAGRVPAAYDNLREGGGGAPPETPSSAESPEGPLSRPPALTEPRTFEDQLHQLSNNIIADRLDVMDRVSKFSDFMEKNHPDMDRATLLEKLYHYEEDPEGVQLTPEEKTIYEQHILPIKVESEKLFNRLEDVGQPGAKEEEQPLQEGYTPRYVKGRTRSFGESLERMQEGAKEKFGGPGQRSLRKTIDAQKSRRFYDAVNPDTGERRVVYIDRDGRALAFKDQKPYELGQFPRGQKLAPGSEISVGNQRWNIEGTTTKKIEKETNVEYNKNVMANRLDQLVKLRSAVRNAEFLEAMKSFPDFESVAVPVDKVATAPETNGRKWRSPHMPQFRNYYFEPKLADAIDDFSRDMGTPEGISQSLMAIQRASNVIMFVDPIMHMKNITNMWLIEKGLVGNIVGLPQTVRNVIKATGEVANLGPLYKELLRTGASLPYSQFVTKDLHNAMMTKLGYVMDENPAFWTKVANNLHYANPVELLKTVSNVSQKVLWMYGDVLATSRFMDYMDKGLSKEDAIKKTEEVLPSYRVPGQVLGNRGLSHEILANPAVGRFGRYQYNRMANFSKIIGDSFRGNPKALDRAAMLMVATFALYPMMDKLWQWVTGNQYAKTTRAGLSSIPQLAEDVATGEKDIGDIAPSLFTPGAPVEIPAELFYGRHLWNGQPIVRQGDVMAGRSQAAIDALNYAANKFSYIGQLGNVAEGNGSLSRLGWSLLGVKAPTEEEVQQKQHYKTKADREAARRAAFLGQKR